MGLRMKAFILGDIDACLLSALFAAGCQVRGEHVF